MQHQPIAGCSFTLRRYDWQPAPCGRSAAAASDDVASNTVAAGLRITL